MNYLIGRPKRPTMKSVLIREVARPARLLKRASSLRVHVVLYNDFDRQRMIDYVGAVVRVMLVRLNGPVGIFGTRQQGVLAGLFWCQPVKFPTSPRVPSHRIEKMRFGPGLAAIGAHRDLRHLSLAYSCCAEDGAALVRRKGFVDTWPGDGGFQLHFCQRAPHRLAIERIPITVVRCLPVTLKRLSHSLDARQPLDRSHSIVTGDNRADRVSMVARKFTPIHLVSNQDFRLNCFFPRHAAGIGDPTRRYGLFRRRAAIGAFEHDFARIVFQAGTLQQGSQRHTRQFCIADCTQLPLRSSNLGDEKDPTITRALQSGGPRFRPHLPQFLVAQRQWVPDCAVDPQLITGDVDPWCWEMTAYVEQLRRGEV